MIKIISLDVFIFIKWMGVLLRDVFNFLDVICYVFYVYGYFVCFVFWYIYK